MGATPLVQICLMAVSLESYQLSHSVVVNVDEGAEEPVGISKCALSQAGARSIQRGDICKCRKVTAGQGVMWGIEVQHLALLPRSKY